MEELIPVQNLNYPIDTLVSQIKLICQHTDCSSGLPYWTSIMTILASAITIASIVLILIEFIRYRRKKRCNGLILQDFIRHLFVNIGIMDVIRIKMEENGNTYDNCYPEEGVFKRMTFLTEDCNFAKYATKSKNYNKIHELELLMRNFNITAEVACTHFLSPAISAEAKKRDLNELTIRAVKLIEKFKNLTKILDIKLLPLLDVLADTEKEVAGINYEGLNFDKRPTELVKFIEEEKVSVLMNRYVKFRYDNYVDIIPFRQDIK